VDTSKTNQPTNQPTNITNEMKTQLTKEMTITATIKLNEGSCIKPTFLTWSDDLIDHCKHYGCETVDDFKRTLLWEEYWDLYKEEHGIRPRWTKWTDRSLEEWEKTVEELY